MVEAAAAEGVTQVEAPPVLEVSEVRKHYGGVFALRDARLSVRRGEVHALVGGNGAGKSTLAKIIAGAVRADRARIRIDARDVSIGSPLDAQRLGIGIIFQDLNLFPNLTVGENLVLGNLHYREGGIVRRKQMEGFCRPFLDRVGLTCNVDQTVASMPIGHRQLLAIARALSLNARILLMDEPTSSLFHDAADRLLGVIRELSSSGVSIVYVSHKMDEIFRICRRATILRDGEIAATVEMKATTAAEIVRLMVGRELPSADSGPRAAAGNVVLRADRLTTRKLKSISFELRRGEALGVAGLVGSGRSELGAALAGLDRVRSGTVWSDGRVGLIPEDPRIEGLMMNMSVVENATMSVLPRMRTAGFLSRRRERAALASVSQQVALECAHPEAPVSTLSGGNQQKVLLTRGLLLDPEVLFLDDPTRGIDAAAKQDIYRLIASLVAAGKGVILVSSELPELIRCCHRILVLNNGRLVSTLEGAAATQEEIMAAATGPAERAG